jgi:hypothetical protein
MTKKAALTASVLVDVPDDSIEKVLIDKGITGTDNYTADDAKDVDLMAIDVLTSLLSIADVSEGGYSVRYDRKSIMDRLNFLNAKHGLVAYGRPTATMRNVW